MQRFGLVLVIATGWLCAPAPVSAQQGSRCADCHYAQITVPAQDHLYDWDRSPHARHGVGCEKCHGGNAASFEKSLAHRGILSPGNRKSPVNPANLPATCGGCHTGPYVAFQESRHFELLKGGETHGPTCSTCHDAVAGRLLSPAALEKQCARCHGPKEIAPRAERAKNARAMYEGLNTVREQLKLPPERVFNNIQRYGNTTAATIPICLSEAVAEGRLREGSLVLTLAFGAGFTWGGNLIRW